MRTSTIQTVTYRPDMREATKQSSQINGIAASWFVVKGRLVCKWLPNEP